MNILNFLSVPDKTIMNKMCIKNKAEVFFYLNVTANLFFVGMDFLILVSLNVKLGPSKTSSLSNDALDILKYIFKKMWMCRQVFVQGVEFSFK
jgi:hypothetical protein